MAQIVRVEDSTSWVEIVAAVGTLVGGVAAAMAAFFSQRTSQEARDALAVGIEPWVMITVATRVLGQDGHTWAVVQVDSQNQWAATNLVMEVNDGIRQGLKTFRRKRVGPRPPVTGRGMVLHEPEWAEPVLDVDAMPASATTLTIVLRYTDERGIWRWEQRGTIGIPISPVTPGYAAFGAQPQITKRRVE